jgi:hypothetical protein
MFTRPTVSHVCGSLQGLAIGFKPGRGPPARTGAGMNDLAWGERAVCSICMEPLSADSSANPWSLPTEMKTTQACVNGHVFHKGCLLKAMRSVSGRKCPECMQPMLKEICDRLQEQVSGPPSLGANAPDPADGGLPVPQPPLSFTYRRLGANAPDPADGGLPVPQPPQFLAHPPPDIDSQIAHQRALARAANTPENVQSGHAEIVEAETRVRGTELAIQQYRERAAAAQRSGDIVTASRILEHARREENLLALHRRLLEGLRQTLRDWLVRDAELQAEVQNAEREDLDPLTEAEVRGRLAAHRIRPGGWLQHLYHRPARERARGLEQWLQAAAPPRTAPSAPLRPTNVVNRRRRSPTHSWRPTRRAPDEDSSGGSSSDDDGVDGDAGSWAVAERRERQRDDRERADRDQLVRRHLSRRPPPPLPPPLDRDPPVQRSPPASPEPDADE